MIDRFLTPLYRPPVDRLGASLAALGITADKVSLAGFGAGLLAAGAVVLQWYTVALVFVLINRVFDGLDGAVARTRGPTDFGGLVDVVLDFAIFALLPLAFALVRPENAIPAAALIAALYVHSGAGLTFAAIANRQGMDAPVGGGLAAAGQRFGVVEGFEMIAFLCLICLYPERFALLAWVFSGLCLLSTGICAWQAHRLFGEGDDRFRG